MQLKMGQQKRGKSDSTAIEGGSLIWSPSFMKHPPSLIAKRKLEKKERIPVSDRVVSERNQLNIFGKS